MSRYINPVTQYFDNSGEPLSGGKLYYYKSGTSSPLTTYADYLMSVINPNPVILDGAGRTPNVFYNGSAKVRLTDSVGGLIFETDPVGGESATGEFVLWDTLISYDKNNIVLGSDEKFYISLTDSNQGNDPALPSPSYWSEIRFIGMWNSLQTYADGDIAQTADGSLWASQINSNLGNDPATDVGANWLPAVSGVKIPEVIVLENRTTKAINQSGGGSLTALRLNRLTDSNTYTLPAANSIASNQWIDLCLPDQYTAQTPLVQRAGTDTIETDTEVLFDAGAISIRLVSNGSNNWRLDL